MFNKPKILVCTDFSEHSRCAVEAALELGKKTAGELYALHVINIPPTANYPSDLGPMYFPIPEELIDSCKKSIAEELSGFTGPKEVFVEIGDAHGIIRRRIEDLAIELVIVGASGRGDGTFPFGSLTAKIVSTSKVPVLVIKKPFTSKHVSVLADPEANLKELLRFSEKLSTLLSAKLTVISLYDAYQPRFVSEGQFSIPLSRISLSDEKREEIEKSIRERIGRCLAESSKAEVQVESAYEKKLTGHLTSILMGNHTDFVVMRRHDKGTVEKFLLGSETRRMLEAFEGNVLVLPPC